jgi:anaerobic magnesium-protoporphyrin IX monomethyl ester cyclase
MMYNNFNVMNQKGMKMQIVTVNPPFLKNYSRQSRSPCVAKSGTIYYSYYLAYAGCAAEMAGFNVTHLDSIAFELSFEQTYKRIYDAKPDLVIIDTSTPSIISDVAFAGRVKVENPNALVFCVGTFPSKNLPGFIKILNEKDHSIDGCLMGEYEETVYELCMALSSGTSINEIDGLVLLNDKSVTSNFSDKSRKTSEQFLNKLPFVSDFYLRHLGESGIKKHFYASITWPYLQLLTARGCPYKCSFCNIPSIGSYRVRDIESVIAELKFIKNNLPYVKEVFIEDDTFPINKKRTIALCKRIIEEKINIKWSCNARVNTDLETISIMKEAGCRLTCVGFESPSITSLVGIIKKTDLKQQEDYMLAAEKVGIKVNGCFIIGLPGDTRESIQNTINYSKKLLPNTAQFYPHMVYPGTGSFEWAEMNDMLEHTNWENWNTPEGYHNTPLRINGISSVELLSFADEGRRQFYTNPKYLIKMLLQSMSSYSEFQRMIIAGRSFVPILFKYIFASNKKINN